MCIRQADCILIVGLAGKDPKVQEVGVLFYRLKIGQRKIKILCSWFRSLYVATLIFINGCA